MEVYVKFFTHDMRQLGLSPHSTNNSIDLRRYMRRYHRLGDRHIIVMSGVPDDLPVYVANGSTYASAIKRMINLRLRPRQNQLRGLQIDCYDERGKVVL